MTRLSIMSYRHEIGYPHGCDWDECCILGWSDVVW